MSGKRFIRRRMQWPVSAKGNPFSLQGSGRAAVAFCRCILLASVLLMPFSAWAGPAGDRVVAGSAAVTRPDSVTTLINQHTDKAIINWQRFSIDPKETVRFQQPGSSSVALNRVLGADPSRIFGRLNANGQVFLVNPSGVLFAPGSQISVHGLLATTHDIRNDDFLSGRYSFFKTDASLDAEVINQGFLQACEQGYIVLAGDYAANHGIIMAKLGQVALASGERFTLDLEGDELISLSVDEANLAARAGVENFGEISADGGRVIMTARVAGELTGAVVNNEGLIRARTIEEHNGEILLLAGMENGTFAENNSVRVSGVLDASAPDGGDGGFIETSGASVKVEDGAIITTLAADGKTGTWLIDPQDYTIAASGGDITGAQLSTSLDATDVIISSADGGTVGSGNIFVNDAVSWDGNTLTLNAERNVEINAEMTLAGNAGLNMNTGAEGSVRVGFNPGEAAGFKGRVNLADGVSLRINNHPYTIINSLSALQAMISNLSGYYALGSDIIASDTIGWNDGKGFAPVGDFSTAFTGAFDGLGHKITGLTINRSDADYVGLFGFTSNAAIRNVGLTDGSVIGGQNDAGSLAGYVEYSDIINCYATGDVIGQRCVGGLVGYVEYSDIINCYATGSVTGTWYDVGGLVGWIGYSTTRNCYATGYVAGNSYVGGLVGSIEYGTISNCYATGDVAAGISYVGGLAGLVSGDVGGNEYSISKCYATGSVAGVSYVGGLVGYRNENGTITSSYWDTDTSGQTGGVGNGSSDGCTGLTTDEMMQQASFVGWDFVTTWGIDEGKSYPFLLAFIDAEPEPESATGAVAVVAIVEAELFALNDALTPVFTLPELEPVAGEPAEGEEKRKADLRSLPLFDLKDGCVSGQNLECE